jgi:hypothetical protein
VDFQDVVIVVFAPTSTRLWSPDCSMRIRSRDRQRFFAIPLKEETNRTAPFFLTQRRKL